VIPTYRLILGDAAEQLQTLSPASVHCVVTSPPYWGLRDYGEKEQIGLEKTPEEYVARLVEVFDQVHRVLRPDGTLWLNLGDSYAQSGRGKVGSNSTLSGSRHSQTESRKAIAKVGRLTGEGLKPKDLVGIPWMVAFALRARGWWLRCDVVWSKTNPMPESIEDRPTRSHEYLFLLSKSERYFYDAEAVKEPATGITNGNAERKVATAGEQSRTNSHLGYSFPWAGSETRNRRSVWTISTTPFPEAHFATFPEALVEPCIMAGTSERGCCSSCGAPLVRQIEKVRTLDGEPTELGAFRTTSKDDPREQPQGVGHHRIATVSRTVGWDRSCGCEGGESHPCTVLDPFNGAGTTGAVGIRLGRSYVGIDLSADYLSISERRLAAVAPLLSRRVGGEG
jgi:DNA modification methylase